MNRYHVLKAENDPSCNGPPLLSLVHPTVRSRVNITDKGLGNGPKYINNMPNNLDLSFNIFISYNNCMN